MENEFYIVPALYDRDTYFLLRDYGNEIKFTVLQGKISIIGNGYFVPKELEFIKQNFL